MLEMPTLVGMKDVMIAVVGAGVTISGFSLLTMSVLVTIAPLYVDLREKQLGKRDIPSTWWPVFAGAQVPLVCAVPSVVLGLWWLFSNTSTASTAAADSAGYWAAIVLVLAALGGFGYIGIFVFVMLVLYLRRLGASSAT